MAITSNLSNVSMTGSDLTGTAGTGLVVFASKTAVATDSPSGSLNIGDAKFAGSLSAYIRNTTLGRPIDATGAEFAGVLATALTPTQAFAAADLILDGGGRTGIWSCNPPSR